MWRQQQGACLVLVLLLASDLNQLCWGRPQQQSRQENTGLEVQESARHAVGDASFFAPGAWHPVVPAARRDDAPRLRIDQDRSRVRGERGEILQRVKRSNATVSTEPPTTTTTSTMPSDAPVESRQQAPGPLGDSIHHVTSQLLGTKQQDVRTPPKIKREEEASVREHQGVAVPVIMEEHELDNLEKVEQVLLSRRNPVSPTVKPEAGLSTWVLLSGSSAPSTVSPAKPTPTTKMNKKSASTTPAPATTKKSVRPVAMITTTTITTTAKPSRTPAITKTPPTTTTRRPSSTATTTTSKQVETTSKKSLIPPPSPPPVEVSAAKVNKVKVSSVSSSPSGSTRNKTGATMDVSLIPAMTRKPPVMTPKPTEVTATTPEPKRQTTDNTDETIKTSTLAPIDSTSILPEETSITNTESNTDNSTETTTKRTRRPGSNGGKKKKNKNKRRKNRPSTTAEPESKITEDSSNSTKIATTNNRPLSTRIYNYLAREVMPSVGVGLLGLVVTAGLAGLIMYPFGSGLAAKRTYDEAGSSAVVAPHGNFYYYNGEYDGAEDSGQAEEAVIKHVFEGMNKGEDGAMLHRHQETQYDTQDSQYPSDSTRYTPEAAQDSRLANGQVTSYAGDAQGTKYSGTRHDSTKSSSTNRRGETGQVRKDSSYYPRNEQEFKYPNPVEPSNSQINQDHKYGDSTNYGRVRYREVGSTATAVATISPTSQDSKKVNTANYETGRVQYREVGSNPANPASFNIQDSQRTNTPGNGNAQVNFREVGSDAVDAINSNVNGNKNTNSGNARVRYREIEADALNTDSSRIQDRKNMNTPENGSGRIRYREVGSDTVHYNANDQMSPGMVEQGPRSLRMKRESSDEKKSMIKNNDDDMFDNEIDMNLFKNKNKQNKKEQINIKPTKITKEEVATTNTKTSTTEKSTIPSIVDTETPSATNKIEAEKISEGDNTEKSSAQVVTEPVDGQTSTSAPEDTTTSEDAETINTSEFGEESTVLPETTTDIFGDKEPEVTTLKPASPFSLMSLVKQVAQFKIQFGLSFLKSTSQAFTRYLDQVQKRMEEAVAHSRQVRYKEFPRDRRAAQLRRAWRGNRSNRN